MFKIKNISNNNINIKEKILHVDETTEINDINDVKTLLNIGYIEIINESRIILDKDKLIEAFFNFHLFKCSVEDLELLKTFYTKTKISDGIPKDILNDINNCNNQEEFTEILLNSFYPAMINEKIKNI